MRRARFRRLPTGEDLADVVIPNGTEPEIDLEPRASEDLGQIGAELGEDGVAPIASGMGDQRGEVLN